MGHFLPPAFDIYFCLQHLVGPFSRNWFYTMIQPVIENLVFLCFDMPLQYVFTN